MSAPKVDVLAVMDRAVEILHGNAWGEDREELEEARAAVAELIAADREYDAALENHKELVRKLTDGWLEIGLDALRKAGEHTVAAQLRRQRALDRIGPQS